MPIKNSGITFQSWQSSFNNLFTQEHCILLILFVKSTFFIPFKYDIMGIQFDNKNNYKKLIHDIGNKKRNKDHKYLIKY